MKNFLMTVVTVCLFGVAAWSDGPEQFAGQWQGRGVYYREGVPSNCGTFELSFDGNRYLMTFRGGKRVCDFHSENFANVSMAHQNGKLFYNGIEVGSIKGNLLETHFSMPESSGRVRHWRMSMRREGRNLVYEESRTMDKEETPLISFAGVLTKK